VKRLKRSERLIYITKYMVQRPGKSISLNHFVDALGVAKSSISEDLALVKAAFAQMGLGRLETEKGAAGGVQYLPAAEIDRRKELAQELCLKLNDPSRLIPGGFLYLTDIIFSPQVAGSVGEVFATYFQKKQPHYVLTVETKGIPIALMTAYFLGVPLLVARREHRVTEGSAVSITYVSGSSRRLQTMSLARRALPQGSKVVVIDDFMKAGGTARGLHELLLEFNAEIVGTGVLIETAEPAQKLIEDYISLLILAGVDQGHKTVMVHPSSWVKGENIGQ
jgi:purine operon repressor